MAAMLPVARRLEASLRPRGAPRPYRALVLAIWLGAATLAATAMHFASLAIEEDIAIVAHERGAALFQLVEMARDWSAGHGGTYVPATERTPPNAWLEHPRRDVTDSLGRTLTLVNPAYMTRQLAEIVAQQRGFRIHITSLKPIRPGNRPAAWETETLQRFEDRSAFERLAFFPGGGGGLTGPVHRYMAPLAVKEACLACHAKQGYEVGDIRGGISVTLPADALVAIGAQRRAQALVLVTLGGLLLGGLGHAVAWHTRRHLVHLEALNQSQKDAIAERDLDLGEAGRERRIAAAVFGNAAEGILVTDRANRILRVNPAFTAITGYPAQDVLGRDPRIFGAGRHDASYFAALWQALETRGRWEGELWNRRRNGEIWIAWMTITVIEGEAGEARYLATFTDITRRKEAEQAILRRANYDPVTGLPNRALFEDRLQGLLAAGRRHGRRFGLLYLDLDHFKQVNDTWGHAAGDALLAEAAQRIEGAIREADTVARLGGDEFAVLLPELEGPEDAEDVGRRILQALQEPFALAEGPARVTASVGIAYYPVHGRNEADLRKAADTALYAAKSAGRNACRFATLAKS